ncbi:MAG: hypothetical protein NHB14_15405 [Desulfosporosinus sp.]|nr:hypothetical protein [Desulfosporosinus sp.]
MHKHYEYSSVFADFIASYISERRNAGFMFDNPAYWLYRFDQFCVDSRITEPFLTKELFDSWSILSPTETKTTQNNRLTSLRCFGVYLNTIGIYSYVPHMLPKAEKTVPYLMDDQDVQSFLNKLMPIVRLHWLILLNVWLPNTRCCIGCFIVVVCEIQKPVH